MSLMVVLNSYAETTSDNLLTNKDFDSGLDSWTVEDSTKIMLDTNCYSQGGLCQSVRWSSDLGKTISQTITELDDNYIIKNVYVSFTALGCNNTAAGGWCTQDGYDKVQVTINLFDGSNSENLYLEQSLDYNDGTLDYALTTSTLDTWLTQDTTINFAITGIDTGNWDGWFGPIVDNINLQLGLEEYIPIVAEPSVVEPIEIVEQPVMVEGLDLNTEVTLDIINDVDIINPLPEIDLTMEVDINVDMDIEVNVSDNIEIEEIEIESTTEPEQSTELVSSETQGEIETSKNDTSNIRGESNDKEENKEISSKEKDSKEESRDSKNNTANNTTEGKTSNVKSTSEDNTSENQTTQIDKEIDTNSLPFEYLQMIQESITIQENVSLTQEQIYGREQEYNLNTSGITVVSLDNNSSSRWRSLQDERKRFKAPSYPR